MRPTPVGKGPDYNLLVALRALLEHRNVTRASEAATIGQSTMSTMLARLRAHYGDELLVRRGRGYELTPLAEELYPAVVTALEQVADVLDPWSSFDPAASTRTFTMIMSDYALAVLAGPMETTVARKAPGVSLRFEPLPAGTSELKSVLLLNDLVLMPMGYPMPGGQQVVFSDRYVCIVAAGNHRLTDGRLTLTDLAELPYATGFGRSIQTAPEAVMAEAGIIPRTAVAVGGLLALPFAVSGTDMFAFVPERLLERCPSDLDLCVAEVPLADAELAEVAHWHTSRYTDAGIAWLCEQLKEVTASLGLQASDHRRGGRLLTALPPTDPGTR
ncbi:LysR family transcriptional regulator [Nocardia sp. NPDC051911]|uniref:LysR family transcriptional regulator n=1 Tax=Nocardia sp. NPDC051911 TaxID=3154648 RepID=UPI00343E9443